MHIFVSIRNQVPQKTEVYCLTKVRQLIVYSQQIELENLPFVSPQWVSWAITKKESKSVSMSLKGL